MLGHRLGRGGNGEVWQARADTGPDVALKVLTRTSGDGLARFRREVELQRGVLSGTPGLLPVLDASPPDGRQWLAMPVAEPLADGLAGAGLDEVLNATAVIAETLGRLHGLGYAHRDVKPGNLYRWEGRWTVGDLGLIGLPDPTPLTAGRRALGPKWFLAPEMLVDSAAAAGGPADVYSLAKTLWVLATGAAFPPPGTHHLGTPALRMSSYADHPRSAFLDRLVERATAYEPADRPAADEFAAELRLIAEGRTMPPHDSGPDLPAVREELRLAADASRRSDASREQRLTAAQDLLDRLTAAGESARAALVAGGAPLAQPDFATNATVLDRANDWHVREPEIRLARCLVSTLRYETGLVGAGRLRELHLWSGFGVIGDASGHAVLVAGHVVGSAIVWSATRLVPTGSMQADQAVDDLAAGLRDSVPAALAALLAGYKQRS